MDTIAARIDAVRGRIAAACREAGRDPATVRLLPVSKTKDAGAVRQAYAAGCRRFGENKVQEAAAKVAELSDLPDLTWAMIGHLQSNKAKVVARFAAEFQALDSLPLAAELDRRLQAEGRRMDVLLQVNSSGEDSKFGLPPEEVVAFVPQLAAFDTLNVRGLMTLAVASPDPDRVATCFITMAEVQRRLRELALSGMSFDELSMGMSGDFELAIRHGSTAVRIGRAIFGERA